jgi:hypothetical protein
MRRITGAKILARRQASALWVWMGLTALAGRGWARIVSSRIRQDVIA